MAKTNNILKTILLMILCFVITSIVGCSEAKDLGQKLIFAGDKYVHVIINDDGSISTSQIGNDKYDFQEWTNIESVTVFDGYLAGVKRDGTVVTAGTDALNVDEWRHIKMAEYIGFGLVGLKTDGTIIFKSYDKIRDYEVEFIEEVLTWNGIIQIDSDGLVIAGLKANGRVVYARALELSSELNEEVMKWTDIKQVSVSSSSIIGLTNNGEVKWIKKEYGKYNETVVLDELAGAVKVGVGQWYAAGLMSDGTVRVIKVNHKIVLGEMDSLDGETGIRDIDCQFTGLYVLKEDGTVLHGGE